MADVVLETIEAVEGRMVRYSDRPIPFETFVELSGDPDVELIDGVLVAKMAVQLAHEKLFGWLYILLSLYVKKRDLGIVLGSRTAVEIGPFKGRLPDLLFVRRERLGIVREKAIYGAPDLVIELVSPNDRPSDIIALETDYRTIGVPEIWFIDQQKRRAKILHKRGDDYAVEELAEGALHSEAVPGFHLQAEWLFHDPRPDEFDTLLTLLPGIVESDAFE